MRTTDEQVNEVFRRAALLRARRLRRKKILLGVCCFALSFHLILLLKGRISMTVATNTATYGSLVFEGIGNHYVLIALAFFLLGIPAGLGVDRLVRWWKKRRIERYAQKWMGGRMLPIFHPRTDKGCGMRPFAAVSAPFVFRDRLTARIAFLLKKRYDETGVGFFVPQGRKRAEVRYGTQSEL